MNFIQSARCMGFSHLHILRSDILPNITSVVLPKFMLAIATAMISEASLAFLGLGDPGAKSWGMMINLAFQKGGLINGMWWWFLPPGVCITLVVVSIMLMSFSWEKEDVTGVSFRR
jgi:peptide/nickel transport system permease protein